MRRKMKQGKKGKGTWRVRHSMGTISYIAIEDNPLIK